MTEPIRLTTAQMARFAAKGFLRLDAVVPEEINQLFLADIGSPSDKPASVLGHYTSVFQSSTIPIVPAGTPLKNAYPKESALMSLVQLPEVAGAIDSLVGLDCIFDHHFLHITFPEDMYPEEQRPVRSQDTHQDSTIDPRQAFDVQMFYFPHDVTPEMGGTRFVPGTQYRIVSEAAIGRYQNIRGQQHAVCSAGTVMFFHMGLWHGGGKNRSDQLRYMFKVRMCPARRQLRLWDPDVVNASGQRPIFWTDGFLSASTGSADDELHAILTEPEPWFEADTGRLEFLNRVRFWRYITGDDNFDADYWVTRVENEYA